MQVEAPVVYLEDNTTSKACIILRLFIHLKKKKKRFNYSLWYILTSVEMSWVISFWLLFIG